MRLLRSDEVIRVLHIRELLLQEMFEVVDVVATADALAPVSVIPFHILQMGQSAV